MKHLGIAVCTICLCLFISYCENQGGDSETSLSLKGSASGSRVSTTAGSPTELYVTVSKLWLSENADCSSAVLVNDLGSSAAAQNMVNNPTLISGNISAGTYRCLIMKIKDIMRFRADGTAVTAHAGCTSTTADYYMDIYRADSADTWFNEETGTTMAGAGTAASVTADQGANAQDVFLYVSTDTTALSSAHANQSLTLSSAFSVSDGDTVTLVFTIDFIGQVSNYNSGGVDYCWCESPVMSINEI